MKIGILTQPLHNNYGGLLQNYALQHTLRKLNCEPETIDWHPAWSLVSWLCRQKQYIYSLFKHNVDKPHYVLNKVEFEYISQNTKYFVDKYLHLCPTVVKHLSDFKKVDIINQYDGYVVGSDQVWRPAYNPMQLAMFLDFVKRENVKRIAYAASFGTSTWEYTPLMTKVCADYLKLFDLISVREESAIEMCKKYFKADAVQALDPTMLLKREEYEKIIDDEKVLSSPGNLFYYILDPNIEKKKFINEIANRLQLSPFTIMPKYQVENRTKKNVKENIDECVFPSVARWLRAFMDAKMVIVDSFHGAVFSIIFNKPFWVIPNKNRGNTRFDSLLSMFHLNDRIISDNNAHKTDWNNTIDWNLVNSIRFEEMARSKELLVKNLL